MAYSVSYSVGKGTNHEGTVTFYENPEYVHLEGSFRIEELMNVIKDIESRKETVPIGN